MVRRVPPQRPGRLLLPGPQLLPSCEKKKQLLWAEWLREDALASVAHRHLVLTIPRLLRPLFRRRRELLAELARAGAEAVKELVRRTSGIPDARPGIVVSVATAGDLLQWHPHLHLITTDGGRVPDGSWRPLPEWDSVQLMRLFRERLLGRLVEQRAMSKELVAKLLAWRHPGFCAHVGETIVREDKQRLEDRAAYLVRNPLSLKKLVYLDGQQAVLYRSKMNPFLGRNFEALDPVEWLARMSDHIVRPRTAPDAVLRRVRQSGQGRAPAARARPGHGSSGATPQALLPKLGEADREGLPGGSTPLHPLRSAHEHRGLRDRRLGHPTYPRPSRSQPAAAGQAPAHPGGSSRRRAR